MDDDIKKAQCYLSNYAKDLSENLLKSNFSALAEIAHILLKTKQTGASVFTAGNGGSGATASHMANDLVKGLRVYGRTGLRAVCLCDPTAIVTCLANDYSYNDIFSIQLATHAKPGDILILFSGSGNSPNIVNAAKYARENGIYIIGFGGRDGGLMKQYCDICVLAPTYSMEMLEDMHLIYEHSIVSYMRDELKDIWDIEIIRRRKPNFSFKSVLFDFDGTISLIREGWQNIMIPYFTEVIMETKNAGKYEDEKQIVTDFVEKLTGKQTIFQCMQLKDEVIKRGGNPLDAIDYKNEYLRRLMEKIHNRREDLRAKAVDPSVYLVKGSLDFLEALNKKGVDLYLASGTDEPQVLEEARLLGIDKYFGGNIFGAIDAQTDCSKEMVIKDILNKKQIKSEELLSFGDGYVEVELVKNAGGYSVAVATDEKRQKGIDEWKRERLLSAGADAVIPDFTNTNALMEFLFGGI